MIMFKDAEENKAATSLRFPLDYFARSVLQLCVFVLTCFSNVRNITRKGNTDAQLTDADFISFCCFTAHYCHPK